jgi:rhamnulokinase
MFLVEGLLMQKKELNLLAFDFGSSSGRAILGRYDGEKIKLEEILKFRDGVKFINNNCYWDVLRLYNKIILGIKKAVEITGNNLTSIGIDTCGVDYGLLDKKNNLLTYPYFYRDNRTDGLLDEVLSIIPKEEIYNETGIQFMQINTLVQLYSDLKLRPWILENAESLLFIPDLLNFFLTGKKYNEYTIASTSQMYNPKKEEWANIIIEKPVKNIMNIPLLLHRKCIIQKKKNGLIL